MKGMWARSDEDGSRARGKSHKKKRLGNLLRRADRIACVTAESPVGERRKKPDRQGREDKAEEGGPAEGDQKDDSRDEAGEQTDLQRGAVRLARREGKPIVPRRFGGAPVPECQSPRDHC